MSKVVCDVTVRTSEASLRPEKVRAICVASDAPVSRSCSGRGKQACVRGGV